MQPVDQLGVVVLHSGLKSQAALVPPVVWWVNIRRFTTRNESRVQNCGYP